MRSNAQWANASFYTPHPTFNTDWHIHNGCSSSQRSQYILSIIYMLCFLTHPSLDTRHARTHTHTHIFTRLHSVPHKGLFISSDTAYSLTLWAPWNWAPDAHSREHGVSWASKHRVLGSLTSCGAVPLNNTHTPPGPLISLQTDT